MAQLTTALALLIGCASDGPTRGSAHDSSAAPSSTPTDSGGNVPVTPTTSIPRVGETVSSVANALVVTERVVTVELSIERSIELTCEGGAEVHLIRSEAALRHQLVLRGLLAETHYDCRVEPTIREPLLHSFTTEPLPEGLPTATATGTAPDAFFLTNWWDARDSRSTQRLLILDARGRVR